MFIPSGPQKELHTAAWISRREPPSGINKVSVAQGYISLRYATSLA